MAWCRFILRKWSFRPFRVSQSCISSCRKAVFLALHSPSPRPVYNNRAQSHHHEHSDDATAYNIEVIANGGHAVPEAPLRIGDILY